MNWKLSFNLMEDEEYIKLPSPFTEKPNYLNFKIP